MKHVVVGSTLLAVAALAGPAATFVVPIWLESEQLGFARSSRPSFRAEAAIASSGQ